MNKKTIWITGASSGIGEATARKFAKEGWKVIVSARRVELLDKLSSDENIFSYPLDVIMSRQIAQNISISQAFKQGALWRGYSICAFRAVLVNSINFSIYEFVMKSL